MRRTKHDNHFHVNHVIVWALLALANASAQSIGPNSPSAADAQPVIPTWADAAHVMTSDNQRAGFAGGNRAKLRAYDFGFSTLPAEATVLGFRISIEGYAAIDRDNVIDVALSKSGFDVIGDAKLGNKLKVGGDSTITLGGPNDLWGAAWSRGDVAANNFAVLIFDSDSDNGALYIDHVQATVYYSVASPRALKVKKITGARSN